MSISLVLSSLNFNNIIYPTSYSLCPFLAIPDNSYFLPGIQQISYFCLLGLTLPVLGLYTNGMI